MGHPHRPGTGMCPRGRSPRPAEGGWLCVQGVEAARRMEKRERADREKAGLRTDLTQGLSPLLAVSSKT